MYFEDILKIASRYWSTLPNNCNIGSFYIENVDNAWKDVDDEYKYWVECLNWSIGVMLSNHFVSNDDSSINRINLSQLNVILLEKRFNEIDLQGESWTYERKRYKGFRNTPHSDQMITKEYLNSI